MHQGLAAFRATGAETARPYYLALLAQVYGSAGNTAEGLTTLAEALATVQRSGERWWEAELYRLRGELLLRQATSVEPLRLAGVEPSALSEVHTCLHQALDIARRQEAKSLELRAALSLSRLWQAQGRHDEARTLLADVYGWFTEGFDTADLREAMALLEEFGSVG
jgi:predicted ATPase